MYGKHFIPGYMQMHWLKRIFLSVFLLTNYCATSQTLKLMTYNIRLELASDKENDWQHRKEMFAAQVKFYEPDIMGVQEALPAQINYLDSTITFFKHVGIGRDGMGKGEASAIFYNHKKFDVITSHTFWLSATPTVVSKGWDASYIRVCTYALLKDKRTKKKFWVFNTHLDNDGVVAREKGVEQILNKMKEVNKQNLPVIFIGDFNATPETKVITGLKKVMNDTRDISMSLPFGPPGTFNGFDFLKPVTQRIDYIFISKTNNIAVNKYAVLSDNDNLHYPSDHLPVYVEIKIK